MATLSQQKLLVFAPGYNSPNLKDATGAFQPEARNLLGLAGSGEVVLFDNRKPMPERKTEVLEAFRTRQQSAFTSVAFLCHGWMDGIQAGFRRRNAPELAAAIVALCAEANELIVPLFCCSTAKDPEGDPLTAAGSGDNSFADRLRDAMCAAGAVNCRVMAHTSVAHTTKNPLVLFMDGMGIPEGGVGGYAPVSPRSTNWVAWKQALRQQDSTLRFRMPYMTAAEIHAELSGLDVS